MTTHSVPHWIATADKRRASLYLCRRTDSGRIDLEQVGTIENRHEQEHERGRPSLLGGAERRGSPSRSSASAAPHAASPRHGDEEEMQRFAREVGRWLGAATKDAKGARVSVFAPAVFLGAVRGEIAGDHALRDRVDLREGEFAHLRPAELAAHPAVIEAVGGRPVRS